MNEELKQQIKDLSKMHTPEETLQILTDEGHILTPEDIKGVLGVDTPKKEDKPSERSKRAEPAKPLPPKETGEICDEAPVSSNVMFLDTGDVDEMEAALLEADEQIERAMRKVEKVRDLKRARGKDISRYLTSLRELRTIKNRVAG